MLALAPGRFSTTTGCPSAPVSFCATSRAMMSLPPPAGNPTIRRTVRAGYSCAADGSADRDASVATNAIECLMLFSLLSSNKRSRGSGLFEQGLSGLHARELDRARGDLEAAV